MTTTRLPSCGRRRVLRVYDEGIPHDDDVSAAFLPTWRHALLDLDVLAFETGCPSTESERGARQGVARFLRLASCADRDGSGTS